MIQHPGGYRILKGPHADSMRKPAQPLNLLDLKPRRTVAWESGTGGVHLVAPKFGAAVQKWLAPVLGRPTFRVRLDEFGAFVWLRCDGSTTVEEIAGQLKQQFGPTVEPLYDRLQRFLNRLEREGFISIT